MERGREEKVERRKKGKEKVHTRRHGGGHAHHRDFGRQVDFHAP